MLPCNGSSCGLIREVIEHIISYIGYLCNYTCMPKNSNSKSMLPDAATRSLIRLGSDLRVARKRRGESLALWSERLQVSIPTLRKVEGGDPTVSVAVYASALWLIGRVGLLGEIANPAADEVALLKELSSIPVRRSV